MWSTLSDSELPNVSSDIMKNDEIDLSLNVDVNCSLNSNKIKLTDQHLRSNHEKSLMDDSNDQDFNEDIITNEATGSSFIDSAETHIDEDSESNHDGNLYLKNGLTLPSKKPKKNYSISMIDDDCSEDSGKEEKRWYDYDKTLSHGLHLECEDFPLNITSLANCGSFNSDNFEKNSLNISIKKPVYEISSDNHINDLCMECDSTDMDNNSQQLKSLEGIPIINLRGKKSHNQGRKRIAIGINSDCESSNSKQARKAIPTTSIINSAELYRNELSQISSSPLNPQIKSSSQSSSSLLSTNPDELRAPPNLLLTRSQSKAKLKFTVDSSSVTATLSSFSVDAKKSRAQLMHPPQLLSTKNQLDAQNLSLMELLVAKPPNNLVSPTSSSQSLSNQSTSKKFPQMSRSTTNSVNIMLKSPIVTNPLPSSQSSSKMMPSGPKLSDSSALSTLLTSQISFSRPSIVNTTKSCSFYNSKHFRISSSTVTHPQLNVHQATFQRPMTRASAAAALTARNSPSIVPPPAHISSTISTSLSSSQALSLSVKQLMSHKVSSNPFLNGVIDKKTNLKSIPLISLPSSEATSPVEQSAMNPTLDSFCLYNSLAKLKGSCNRKLDAKLYYNIKPLPLSWPKNEKYVDSMTKLDKLLKESNFTKKPIDWMIKNELITRLNCPKCLKPLNYAQRYQPGLNATEFWICSCRFREPINFPVTFADFSKKPTRFLNIIYYWATQEDIDRFTTSKKVDCSGEEIYHAYTNLRSLCSRILAQNQRKLTSSKNYAIDLATVQIGNLFVLGAMELATRTIRLTSFSLATVKSAECKGINIFAEKAREWITVPSIIQISEKKFNVLEKYGYKLTTFSKKEFNDLNLKSKSNNIGGYLIQQLQKMFRNIDLTSINHKTMEHILSELEWRETFGYDPFTAFSNIIKHIKTDPLLSAKIPSNSSLFEPKPLSKQPIWVSSNNEAASSTFVEQGSRHDLSKLIVNPSCWSKQKTNYVEEYYYAFWFPKNINFTSYDSSLPSHHRLDIICHLCQMLFDKILISKHILEHIEKEKLSGRCIKQGNQNECGHCLKSFDDASLQTHRDLFNCKPILYGCRICCLSLPSKDIFLKHMRDLHWPKEAPFICKKCQYRTSFHKDLLNHFSQEHKFCDNVMCPLCLKLFKKNQTKSISKVLYDHLVCHYIVSPLYSCSNCCLTFISKEDKADHIFTHHTHPSNYESIYSVECYKLQKEEKELATRGTKEELINFDRLIELQKRVTSLDSLVRRQHHNIPSKRPTHPEFSADYVNFSILRDLTINGNRSRCFECNTFLDESHFSISLLPCTKCKFKTYCYQKIKQHKKEHNEIINSYLLQLSQPIVLHSCVCGYSPGNGDQLASHLAISGHPYVQLIS